MLPVFEIQARKLVAESVSEWQRVAVASASARGWPPLQMTFDAMSDWYADFWLPCNC